MAKDGEPKMKFGSIASLFLFAALLFLSSANIALFSPHEVHLAREFKTSILAIDFVMFLSVAIPALFLPLWGVLCDRAGRGGRKNLLLMGVLLWSISSLIIYFASSYLLLLIARIITGIGAVIIFPVGFSIITDYVSPQKRGKALSIFPIIVALGTGGGIILANVFGATVWRPPFLMIGIMGLIVFALSFLA